MGWFVSALGVALALAGAAAIASGVPYIQLEWGWTEVIAGTTALSAGIVTLAIGAVLFALRGLRRVLDAVAAAGVPAGTAIPTVLPFPDADPDSGAAPAGNGGASSAMPEPAAPPARRRWGRPTSKLRASSGEGASPDEGADSPSVAPGGRLAATGDAEFGDPPSTSAAPVRKMDDGFADHRPSIDPASPLRTVGAADVGGEHAPTFDRGSGPAPSFIPSRKLEEPARHVAEVPTVVGRYEAGGASYVLFSDGAIEVAAETGTHRFASMQDLRDHIERQEAVE